MYASALLEKSKISEICIEINKKVDRFHLDLRAPTAGRIQGLTVVVQQCVYQIMFRNVDKIQEATGEVWIGPAQNHERYRH